MNLLDKIVELEIEAADFGFVWENPYQIMEQIESECVEVREHLQSESAKDRQAIQEEIGDLMHAVFSLCVFCKLDPKVTLQKTTEKFERRLRAVKQIAKEKNRTHLKGIPFDELMAIWREAKNRVG